MTEKYETTYDGVETDTLVFPHPLGVILRRLLLFNEVVCYYRRIILASPIHLFPAVYLASEPPIPEEDGVPRIEESLWCNQSYHQW